MKKSLRFITFLIIAFSSCGQQPNNLTYTNSGKVALNLIQLCVNLTLQLDPGLNTGKYFVDFSFPKDINRRGIDNFLKLNNKAKEANLDSLISQDTTWTKYQFFQNPVIRFEKIRVQADGTILINIL